MILALFFGQAVGDRAASVRVVAGQYLGFAAILAAAVVGALSAGLLPESAVPYLGLLPLGLGLRAGWRAWRERRDSASDEEAAESGRAGRRPSVGAVAAVTLANGGDNIGVYVPVFATAGIGSLVTYVTVFLALVAVWCLAGSLIAGRQLGGRVLSRWGHVLLPIVLIGIGVAILVEGHAFWF